MEASSFLSSYTFPRAPISRNLNPCNRRLKLSPELSIKTPKIYTGCCILRAPFNSGLKSKSSHVLLSCRARLNCLMAENGSESGSETSKESLDYENFGVLAKRGLILAVLALSVIRCRRVLAMEGLVSGGYAVLGRGGIFLRGIWPTVLQILRVFKEHGLVLAALLSLSAFFSMAETSITTLWPWKVWPFTWNHRLILICTMFIYMCVFRKMHTRIGIDDAKMWLSSIGAAHAANLKLVVKLELLRQFHIRFWTQLI